MGAFLDLSDDPGTDFGVKLLEYARLKDEVLKFHRYYVRCFRVPLMERLKAEVQQLMEDIVSWWFQQLEAMG